MDQPRPPTPFQYHPAVAGALKHFRVDHLLPGLQAVALEFRELAVKTAERAPAHPETVVALRKLLEAKDAAVRAVAPED
jgi:hypothetical protein